MNRLKADPIQLTVFGNGTQAKPYLHVDDLVRAILLVWDRASEPLAVFHIGNDDRTTVAELARIVRRENRPSAAAIRRLSEQPRDILAPLRTLGITDARLKLASILDEIEKGRTLTIVSSGRFAATLVAPREFDRLRALARTVSWFRAAGLDLAAAHDADVTAFVQDFATRASASDAAAG